MSNFLRFVAPVLSMLLVTMMAGYVNYTSGLTDEPMFEGYLSVIVIVVACLICYFSGQVSILTSNEVPDA